MARKQVTVKDARRMFPPKGSPVGTEGNVCINRNIITESDGTETDNSIYLDASAFRFALQSFECPLTLPAHKALIGGAISFKERMVTKEEIENSTERNERGQKAVFAFTQVRTRNGVREEVKVYWATPGLKRYDVQVENLGPGAFEITESDVNAVRAKVYDLQVQTQRAEMRSGRPAATRLNRPVTETTEPIEEDPKEKVNPTETPAEGAIEHKDLKAEAGNKKEEEPINLATEVIGEE